MAIWDHSIVAVEDAWETIQRARATRLHASQTCARAAHLHDTVRTTLSRLRVRTIRGGAESTDPAPFIRQRIRDLIDAGELPEHPPTMIWAGASNGTRTCGVCRGALAVGAIEYEVVIDTAIVFMHLGCVEAWSMEAERRLDVAAIIREKMASGELPSTRSGALWISNGRGESCTACGQPVSPAQVLHDFTEAGRRFQLHAKCWRAWHDERGLLGLT
jgi:hypothetical protein